MKILPKIHTSQCPPLLDYFFWSALLQISSHGNDPAMIPWWWLSHSFPALQWLWTPPVCCSYCACWFRGTSAEIMVSCPSPDMLQMREGYSVPKTKENLEYVNGYFKNYSLILFVCFVLFIFSYSVTSLRDAHIQVMQHNDIMRETFIC